MTQLTAIKAPVIRIGGTAADVTPGRAVLEQHPDHGAWLLLHSTEDGPVITPEFDRDEFLRIVVGDETMSERDARKAARAHLQATHYDGDPTRAHKVAAAIQRYLHQAQRWVTSEELFFDLVDAFTGGELSGAFLEFGGHVADGDADSDTVTLGDVTRAMLALCVNGGKWGHYAPDQVVTEGTLRGRTLGSWIENETRNGAHRFHLVHCA